MKVWYIDGDRYTEDDMSDLLDRVCDPEYWADDCDAFDEFLNENNDEYSIGGCTFSPATILYECNSDAYSEAKWDWACEEADNAKDDARWTLDHMSDGEWQDLYACEVRCEIEEEDDDDEEETDEETHVSAWVSEIVRVKQEKIAQEKQAAQDWSATFATL